MSMFLTSFQILMGSRKSRCDIPSDTTQGCFHPKVLGMKNTCYILLVHLIKMTFLTRCQVERSSQSGQMSIKMAMA